MTITSHNLETEPLDESLAMLLVGDKKAGKSWLAATAPAPVFFLDFDQRLGALRGRKGVYGLSFADPTDTNLMPTAFNEMLGVLTKLEKSRSMVTLNASLPAIDIRTLVFDSVSTIADSARRYVMYSNADVTKAISIGGKIYRVAKTYHAWGAEMEMVTGAIMMARAIPGLNVIVVLHECMEEDERSTPDNKIYTGKIEVFPRRYNTLLIYFNEVWRLVREYGKVPKVFCDPDGKFTQAATALGIDKIDVPDISQVLRLAKSRQPQMQLQTQQPTK